MGQHYRGEHPVLMQEQVVLSRRFLDNEIERLYPGHTNWVHILHRGNMYHFYRNNAENLAPPERLDLAVSVRIIRDFLFELEPDQQDHLVNFELLNGEIAARIQIHRVNIELENMPRAVRIYQHWLHFGFEHPQFNNNLIILE